MISVCVCVCVPNEIHILLRDSDNYGSSCDSRSMQIHTKVYVSERQERGRWICTLFISQRILFSY